MFTAGQAVEEGWTGRQVRRRREAGRWVRVAGDGLAAPAPRWTPFQLALAAQPTWPGCVASHLTAAALHGFPVATEQVAHVITNKGHRPRRSITPDVSLLSADEVSRLPGGPSSTGGPALTSVRSTAADCLAGLTPDAALDLWAWLSARRVLQHADLVDLVGSRRGWRGTTQLADLARATAGGAVSSAERRLHALLQEAGISGWVAGAAVHDQNEVEVDGWRAHSSRHPFETDRRRQNRLINAGYLVLRFTWDDLTRRPAQVLAEIRRALSWPAPR